MMTCLSAYIVKPALVGIVGRPFDSLQRKKLLGALAFNWFYQFYVLLSYDKLICSYS